MTGGSGDDTVVHLFVYGTLLPGEVRWVHLEPFVDGPGRADAVTGTLYDTGRGYPAFRPIGAQAVQGMTFRLRPDRRAEALAVLDEIEGAVEGLYRRVTMVTEEAAEVFVYEYGGGLDLQAIPGGSWLSR